MFAENDSDAYLHGGEKENFSPDSSSKSSQWAPLFKAVLKRDSLTLKELLERGTQPDVRNDIGETSLLKAVENEFEEIVELLLNYGANPNTLNKDGDTLAHVCCFKRNLAILLLLCKNGASLQTQNAGGSTCLHLAAENGDKAIMAFLLEHKVDVNVKDNEGRTPLERCQSESERELFLLEPPQLKALYSLKISAKEASPEKKIPLNEVSNFTATTTATAHGSSSLQKKAELISKQISPERKNENHSVDQIELKIMNSQPAKMQGSWTIPEDLTFLPEKAIFTWLQEINLEALMQNFMDNAAYENFTLFNYLRNSNDWNKCLITLFGIDKPGHRFRICLKVKEEIGLITRKGLFSRKNPKLIIKFPSMEDWLNSIGLGATFDLFEQSGFDHYESLLFSMTLPDESLDEKMLWEEIGIEDPDQRLLILSRLMEDASKAAGLEIPSDFEGEIAFECSGKRPPTLRSSCTLF